MSKRWIAGLAWIPMVVLLGCAEEAGETDADTEEPATAEAPADGAAGDSPMGRAVRTEMESRNESGITGEAQLTMQTDSLLVTVDLEGLEAGTEYASHIHSGTCEEPGGVVVPLESVPGGEGSSATRVAPDQLAAGQSHLIMSHGAGGQPVACGDLPEGWRSELGAEGGMGAAGGAGAGEAGGAQGG